MSSRQPQQLQLLLRSLEIKSSAIKNQLSAINDSIAKLDANITKLQDYSEPYKNYAFSTEAMHSQFLINNDIFLQKISKAIASAEVERAKLEKQQHDSRHKYSIILRKMDGLSNLLDDMAIQQQIILDDLEDTEQTDRFNTTFSPKFDQ